MRYFLPFAFIVTGWLAGCLAGWLAGWSGLVLENFQLNIV
jgi:hypothetical protein